MKSSDLRAAASHIPHSPFPTPHSAFRIPHSVALRLAACAAVCAVVFAAADARVFGVSRDSVRAHDNFCAKQGFNFPLISDADEALCQAFDVIKMKNMYGKQVRGIERSTFLISPDGHIAASWRKVKVAGHAQAVLETLLATRG